jgi:hypothetical protein
MKTVPEELLEERGYDVMVYYLRISDSLPARKGDALHPRVTVCLAIKDGLKARGIAICVPKDNPNKAIGRALAARRALRAVSKMSSVYPKLSNAAQIVLGCSPNGTELWSAASPVQASGRAGLSEWNPVLTEYEQRMLKRRNDAKEARGEGA